jgi:hypothetical protein
MSYPSTITYQKAGLKIVVDFIPDLPMGMMTSDIQITLQMSVPYTIKCTPVAPNLEFIPPVISFESYLGPVQKFR